MGPTARGQCRNCKAKSIKKACQSYANYVAPLTQRVKAGFSQMHFAIFNCPERRAFPTSIIEALSYGLPIIVSEGTTWKDLAEVYGVGFGVSDDVGEIGKKIIAIVDNPPLRQSMAKNATEIVKKHFQWSAIAEKYENFYSEVISHKASG